MPTVPITEGLRTEKLRRVNGTLLPSVTRDSKIPGFALHVTSRRCFWALHFQPKGINPVTGRRWGGGMRHELGDAVATPLSDARASALAAKALVRQGRDPLREARASRASAVADRAILRTKVAGAIDAYEKALMARRQPSEATRKQAIAYASKAVRLMKAEALNLSELDPRAVRLLIETAPGSNGERRHVFGGLNKFLTWCRRHGLVEHNPCDALDRGERPKPGRARDNVPSLEELQAIWAAAGGEPMRDLVRFLLLVPLRRDEAAGLRWSEVDLDRGRVLISADRMKGKEPHELPLAEEALRILAARKPANIKRGELIFPSGVGKAYDGWDRLTKRIRRKIDQEQASKAEAFAFHDIRRAFVSHLACRFDVDLLDQCLSHARKGVLGIYQRSARMPERAAAMRTWGELICSEAQADADNVIRLAAR